jgi:hypothetical protein
MRPYPTRPNQATVAISPSDNPANGQTRSNSVTMTLAPFLSWPPSAAFRKWGEPAVIIITPVENGWPLFWPVTAACAFLSEGSARSVRCDCMGDWQALSHATDSEAMEQAMETFQQERCPKCFGTGQLVKMRPVQFGKPLRALGQRIKTVC